MKKIITLISLLISFNSFAQSTFEAIYIKDLNILSISMMDDSRFPPYDSGKLWSAIRGVDQRKYVEASGLSIECDGISDSTNQIYGACTLNISMDLFKQAGDMKVLKLTGNKAAKLNRYFVDSAYVTIERGGVYLSSYNTRREFSFGIKDSLIRK